MPGFSTGLARNAVPFGMAGTIDLGAVRMRQALDTIKTARDKQVMSGHSKQMVRKQGHYPTGLVCSRLDL